MLWKYGSNVPYSTSTADDKAAFDALLNQVCDRFLKAGYSDTLIASLTAYPDKYGNAFITLPRELNSVIGSVNQTDDCFGSPLKVRSTWYEFLPNGTGMNSCDAINIKAMPGRFTTFQDWSTPMLLRVKLEQTESATIIFRGKLGGEAIYSLDGGGWIEGVKLSLTNATVTTTEYFDEPPYGVVKTTTNGRVSIYAVDTNAVEYLVAIYEPDENVPKYRRYKVPNAVTATQIGTGAPPALGAQFYTLEQINALFGSSGTITVNADGTHDLTVIDPFVSRTVRVIAQAGTGAYTHKFSLDNSTALTDAIFRVRLEIAASANPTLEFYDNTTAGTLLQTITGDSSNATYLTFMFEFDGANWVYIGSAQ
jgi:hypothetical protein